MLQLLVDYARSHCLTIEPGFKSKMVKWGIRFTPEGKLSAVVPLGQSEEKGWKGMEFPACPDLAQPELVAGSETRCHFLVEVASAVCLYHEKGQDALKDKDREKNEYFVRLLRNAARSVPGLEIASRALSDNTVLGDLQSALANHKARGNDLLTVGIDGYPGTWIVKGDSWHDWWRGFRRSLSAKPDKPSMNRKKNVLSSSSTSMRCVISGELVEPAATHPRIEGLGDVGGQASGTALVSFDKESFGSFGLEQSANASTSEEMAAAYRGGLNALIRETGRRLAGAKVVHWYTGEQPEEDPIEWFNDADDTSEETKEANAREKARALLDAIRSGNRPELGRSRYYALTLSGSGGRVMMRDWMEGQFEDLVRSVHTWYDDLEMVKPDGEIARSPTFYRVLGALVRREKGKSRLEDVPTPLESRLWRSAMRNEFIPDEAQAMALKQFRSDIVMEPERIGDPVRMGLLRAHLLRKGDLHMKPYLNPQHPDRAYHCGRLLAVLARLQESALPNVKAGVVQRFYPAASSTPALVIGRMIRAAQFHIDKLSSKGLAYWYQQKIAEIMGPLGDDIPQTLTLQQQSVFALGFYQQYAELSSKKEQDEAPSIENTLEEIQ